LRNVGLTQTDVATWAASSTLRTSLERQGLITRVVFTPEITPSATLAGAVQENGLYRALLNHRIVAGGHTFMELPSTGESGNAGTLMHYVNNQDFGGMPGFPDQQSVAGPDRTYMPISFIFHCGSRPKDMYGRDNPFDLSAFIPAFNTVDLIAEWVTGLNSVLDDTVTISSGTGRYTIYTVIGTHAEIQAEMARQGVRIPAGVPDAARCNGMMPAWVAETFALDTTYTDYSLGRNIPTGRYLKRIAIASQDASATRALLANDEVTGVKVSIRLQDVMKQFQDAMSAHYHKGNFAVDDDAVEFGAGGHAKGIILADLRPYGHADYGLNLLSGEAAQVGAPRLGLTVTTNASGDDLLMIHEGYVPYYGPLGF